jgi:hypothetical protein
VTPAEYRALAKVAGYTTLVMLGGLAVLRLLAA